MTGSLEHVAALKGHRERAWYVSWRRDGTLLASCSGDRTVRLWAVSSIGAWTCAGILEDAQGRTIRACEWSPDGRYLASVSFDATTVIWEKRESSYEVVASLEGHESEVKSVAWSPSGSYIATCSRDKSIWIWEADADTDFECLSVLHGHTQDVKFVTWHPTQDLLVSTSYDNTIRVWAENEDDWYCKETLTGHEATVWGVAFNAEGTEMASVSDDNAVILWHYDCNSTEVDEDGSSKQWQRTSTLSNCHERTVFSVDWTKQGDYVVTGAGDNAIRVFQRSPSPRSLDLLVEQKQAHASDINCVRWSPAPWQVDDHGNKSLWLASAGDDALVHIWRFHLP